MKQISNSVFEKKPHNIIVLVSNNIPDSDLAVKLKSLMFVLYADPQVNPCLKMDGQPCLNPYLFCGMSVLYLARLGVIPVFLLALTITLVLVFFPRSPETAPAFREIEVRSSPI